MACKCYFAFDQRSTEIHPLGRVLTPSLSLRTTEYPIKTSASAVFAVLERFLFVDESGSEVRLRVGGEDFPMGKWAQTGEPGS